MNKCPFQLIKEFLAAKQVGSQVTRQQILTYIRASLDVSFSEMTVDSIRRELTVAGYLSDLAVAGKKVNGVYIIKKHPEPNLTKSVLMQRAYGYTRAKESYSEERPDVEL